MNKDEERMTYVSPMVKTIELKIGAMLCQSGGIDKMQRDDDGGSAFN